MKNIFLILMAIGCIITIYSCSKDDTTPLSEPEALTRNAGISDSFETDSGKVRYGDVVIDTTWAGETHLEF